MSEIDDLIRKLKESPEPSRALDAEALCLIFPDDWSASENLPDGCIWGPGPDGRRVVFWPGPPHSDGGRYYPHLTSDIHAALSLMMDALPWAEWVRVPKWGKIRMGVMPKLEITGWRRETKWGQHISPATALLIATLLAIKEDRNAR